MAPVTHHWHGYGPWTGPHETFEQKNDYARRAGLTPSSAERSAFVSSTTPPIETGFFLLRRDQTARERTWVNVQSALDWLVAGCDRYPPDRTLNYLDLPARLLHTRVGLEAGVDGYWHYTSSLSANRVVVLAVICCPHRHHTQTPCPLPPN